MGSLAVRRGSGSSMPEGTRKHDGFGKRTASSIALARAFQHRVSEPERLGQR